MNVIQTHDVTAIEGSVFLDGILKVESFAASAQRHPEDRNDPVTGLLLAQARFYEKVAKRFYREARGRIKHADDMAADKARRKANNG